MGRQPKQVCSVCGAKTTQAATRADGAGGRRCKEECGSEAADAADAANKAALERVAAASPKTAARLASEAAARDAAHRKAVLDVLGSRPADLSYSSAEVARMSGVPSDEIDAVIAAMLADGALEEMGDEEDEPPTYRAKPAAPPPPKPAANRRGKPTIASEAARTCRVCACTAEKPCDGPCCWSDVATPAGGDTCSVCAAMLDVASEALADGTSAAELSKTLADGAPLGVSSVRVGKVIEIAIAASVPTKKTRPAKKKAAASPAQAVLPGSEVARTLTLPAAPPVVHLPAEDRGTCSACGVALTPENVSRLSSGRVVHVGCSGKPAEIPIELSSPCGGCDGERGEACAWATPEPASYVHPQRVRLLSAEEQREVANRATADRIRALCDHYAGLASAHPMPTEAAIMRAVTSDGTLETLAADVFGAMIERGEIVAPPPAVVNAGTEVYYRRAPGSPAVVMGRVGVKVATPEKRPEGLAGCAYAVPGMIEGPPEPRALARWLGGRDAVPDLLGRPRDPYGAGMRESEGIVEYAQRIDEEATAAAMLDAMGPPVATWHPFTPGVASEALCAFCGKTAAEHAPLVSVVTLADARSLSPAERMLVATSEIVRAAEEARVNARACLAAEVRERAAMEQLNAVQRERDAARADVAGLRAQLANAPREIMEIAERATTQRDAAETAIRDLADALGVDVGASPAETCAAVAKKTTADVALAKDLARLAQIETSERTEEARKLRGERDEADATADAWRADLNATVARVTALRAALANLYERCGGTDVPEGDADLIAATADRVTGHVLTGVSPEVATLRAAADRRQVEKEEAEEQAAEMEVQCDIFAARVLTLRAGIVAALAAPPAAPADLDDAALVALLRGRDRAAPPVVPTPAAPAAPPARRPRSFE